MTSFPSPAAGNYRMPAEWEPHAATWLSWPHNRDTWPGRFEPIPALWRRLTELLAPHETVHILAAGDALEQAHSMIGHLDNVHLHDVPTNDTWIRDHGPTFLTGPPTAQPALIDWQYNAWGGKYPPFDADNAVPRHIAKLTGRHRFEPGIVLEGGALDTNGRGLFLAAQACLTDPRRNPRATTSHLERLMAAYLGAEQVIWLDAILAGDDTDGHVDQIARFVGSTTVVVATESDTSDPNHASLAAVAQRLRTAVDTDGRPLDVVPLPMPRPMHVDGTRVPASYANFYVANNLVLVPQYDDPADERAVAILREQFAQRQIIPLPATDLIWGLGAVHCITQHEPAS